MTIYETPLDMIGNTPLLKIPQEVHGLKNFEVYAKLEYMNPFGSVKDRIAKGMLSPILPELQAKKKTILEASSGNTAKALCGIGGFYGLSFKTVTNRIKVPEVRMTLQLMGSEIEELPGLSDCPDPNDPNDYTTVAQNLATNEPEKYHYTDQYFNELNRKSHEQTGAEILKDIPDIYAFFGCLGTCGTTMGAGDYLKNKNNEIHIYGVVGSEGHHLPGGRNLNELWEVGFFRKDFYTEILHAKTQASIEAMILLNRKCGMMCGPTTGLTYYAMIEKLREIDSAQPEKKKAVFIACDRAEMYMSYLKRYKPELFEKKQTRKTVESQTPEEVMQGEEIEPEELQSIANDVILIDIRGHFAFRVGHIENSINILNEVLNFIVEEGTSFPKKKLVIICPNGTLSRKYASFLSAQGYDAFSLKGGFLAWKNKGLPTASMIHAKLSKSQ
ncbi:MAG: pyridoxal-phosphate dependent enzyme [Candidatus Woesearchaeota archaeon]